VLRSVGGDLGHPTYFLTKEITSMFMVSAAKDI
jgi:hypothetical protein